MRIAIDARMMGPTKTRGIGRYIEELVRAFVAIAPEHRYVLLTRDPATSPFQGHASVEHVAADVPWYGLREQLEMPGFLRAAKADVVHVPHWNVPLSYRGPLVITIHDLLLMHQPLSAKASLRGPMLSRLKRIGFRLSLRHAVKAARVICVPTADVAHDLEQSLSVPRERIVVTGEGVVALPSPDPRFVPSAPFLLVVGSAYPHKRLDLLLSAWQRLTAYRPELRLVITGEEDAFLASHIAWVKQHAVPHVLFTGRVTDAELAGLYAQALALVTPSSFEGFSLPPLEALSEGTPVIASDIGVHREVLPTDGVFFFKNGDRDGMIQAIERALSDPSAETSAERGWEAVRQRHDWRRAAEHTLDAYVRAASLSF